MSSDSSNKLLSIVNNDTPNDIFIHLITIEWNDNTVDRYVKNYKDVTSRGDTFQASNFNINLPSEIEDEVPTINVEFSLADNTIIEKLRQSQTPPTLILEIVLASDTNIVEAGPFEFDVRRFNSQGVSASMEAGFEPILDFVVPQISYTPTLFPGIFKDIRAGD